MSQSHQALFICYPRCSTCAKARSWLNEHHIDFKERDIAGENPSYQELKDWKERSGLPVKRFFNTSGRAYRQLDLAHKLTSMSEDQALKLLATDGMLVKRPILVSDGNILVGFRLSDWEGHLNA